MKAQNTKVETGMDSTEIRQSNCDSHELRSEPLSCAILSKFFVKPKSKMIFSHFSRRLLRATSFKKLASRVPRTLREKFCKAVSRPRAPIAIRSA